MMTHWDILGIEPTKDRGTLWKAFVNLAREVDFKTDRAEFFEYLKAYQSIDKTLINERKRLTAFPWGEQKEDEEGNATPYFDLEVAYTTPQDLVERFQEIYSDKATRFNIMLWKSAIINAKQNTTAPLEDYCLPILHFLQTRTLVKSDVLFELRKAFPIFKLIQSDAWVSEKEANPAFDYLQFLLANGNLELDLQVDVLLKEQYNTEQIDLILHHLGGSTFLASRDDLAGAYNILAKNIPPDIKPLMVWQRELNILYKSVIIQNIEEARPILISVLNECLQRFPGDGQTLYIRAAYLYRALSPDKALEEIIATLRLDPANEKIIFLLGKCFLDLKLDKEAREVFSHLAEASPLNLEFAAALAIATNNTLESDFIDSTEKSKEYYHDLIYQLSELNLFEKIKDLEPGFPNDEGIRAMLLYARASEQYDYHGIKEKELLFEAINIAPNQKIKLQIIRKLLTIHSLFGEIEQFKDFIHYYLEEFPDDDILHFKAGCYYYFVEDNYEKALAAHKKAREINPKDLGYCKEIARNAEHLKLYDEAIDNIAEFLEEYQFDVEAYEILGRCYYNTHKYLNAYKCFKRIINISPGIEIKASSLFLLLTSLYNFSISDPALKENPLFKDEINNALQLFESTKKGQVFTTDNKAMGTFFWAAKLCAMIEDPQRGLHLLNLAIRVAEVKGTRNLEDIPRDKAKFLLALARHEEITHFLPPFVEYLGDQEAPNYRRMADCSYYLALAYERLQNEDEEYNWRLRTIDYYAADNTDQDWMQDYCFTTFKKCLDWNNLQKIIISGITYLNAIEAVYPNHVMVAHYMGLAYEDAKDLENSRLYHEKCLEFAEHHPTAYSDMIEASRTFLAPKL